MLLWAGDHEEAASLAKEILGELEREVGTKKHLNPRESIAGLLAEQAKQVQAWAKRLRAEDMEQKLSKHPASVFSDRPSKFSSVIVRSDLVVLDVRGAVRSAHFGWIVPESGHIAVGTDVRANLLPGDNHQQELAFSLSFGNCFAGQISFYSLGMAEGRFYDLAGYDLEQTYRFQEKASRIAEALKTLSASVFGVQ